MPELKPCPFCGSASIALVGEDVEVAICNTCGAQGPAESKHGKRQYPWNRRTPDLTEALARLKALEERIRVIVNATDTLEWQAVTALPNEWADEIAAIRKELGQE